MQKYESAKHTHEQMKKIQTLLIRLLWGQLQSAGIFIEKESSFAHLKAKAGLINMYDKWFEASTAFLMEHHFLDRKGDTYKIHDCSLVDLEALWEEWDCHKANWLEDPNRKARIVLMENMIRAIPDIITGKLLATEVMFPNSSMELVEGIYKHNVIADYFNEIMAERVVAYIVKQRDVNPRDRVRILEIGAGTGGTSSMLLHKLKPYHDAISEYCYTDVSKAFLMHGEREYGPDNSFLTIKHLDIGQPVALQAIDIGGYDLIIAANVLHATKNIRQTLRNAKAMLKEKGLILLNELTDNSLANHLTFSLIEGWWMYEDPAIRIPGCPGLYPKEWKKALEMEGYQAVSFPAAAAQELGQQIIVAESDGIIRLPEHASAAIEPAGHGMMSTDNYKPLKVTAEERIQAGKVEVTDTIIENVVKDAIAGKISESLKIDRAFIDAEAAFSDYGVDSITGVQLIQAVNQMLDITLKTTDLFDYGSLGRLTNYIVSKHREVIAKSLSGAATPNDSQSIAGRNTKSPLSRATVQTLSAQVQQETGKEAETEREDIAIIGMSGRFAGSASVHELWEHLVNGTDLVQEVTRWDLSEHFPDSSDYCRYGSFLEDIDQFDPLFFTISGIEATYMDPQQRIFLEEAWKALEDAGYAGTAVEGTRCGVYIGSGQMDYRNLIGDHPPAQAYWGNANSITPARIAYYLDLQGPAIAVDTACSSSLVAIHLACQGLWAKETEMALAGGVFVMSTPDFYVSTNRAGMFSRHGRCYAFDQRADGFVPGEGAGVVVLKRLQDAVADRDQIYGIIRGTGINQDGATNGITAPSANSQERLQQYVYDSFNVNPEHIQLIEAHGTGTQLGDPIEYEALSRTFGKYTKQAGFCALGSIKTNIGHLTAAAGIAGLIKILLCLKHKQMVPSLHYKASNPNIEFKDSPFYVNTNLQDWKVEPGIKRRAALSSFGFSGTNAHMVIEEAPKLDRSFTPKPGYIIVLSAQTTAQLAEQARQLADFCEKSAEISTENVSWTLCMGRKHWNYRLACVARHSDEIVDLLKKWLDTGVEPRVYISSTQQHESLDTTTLTQYGNDCIRACSTGPDEATYLERLSTIASLYAQGCNLTFDGLFADGGYSRISLPTYPFAKERYWVLDPKRRRGSANSPLPSAASLQAAAAGRGHLDDQGQDILADMIPTAGEESVRLPNVDEEQLRAATVKYLIKLLASTVQIPESRIEAGSPLDNYGIDSIMIVHMTNELELVFGPLPKTLFFEYHTIRELEVYFAESHWEKLNELWGKRTQKASNANHKPDTLYRDDLAQSTAANRAAARSLSSQSRAGESVEQVKNRTDIAIIGLSGRYPGAHNMNHFWDNLRNVKDCITEIPPERWDYRLHFQEGNDSTGKTQSKWGGFLDGVDRFDPLFFNISPRDAEMMDPQERLFLECVYEAIEDAGYTRESLRSYLERDCAKDVGVYVGVTYEEYQLYGAQAQALGQPYALVGSPASIANRVSYYFNFHGPSVALDTMCSSSLTALHYACQSLQKGECGLAVAGGVNVSVHPNKYLMLTQGSFLSSKGRCESFGKEGDGYVPGEGVGAVLLKPLVMAEADGDHIYGVIKGTAVNHGGKTNGYTVPNPNAQASVIERALQDAGVHPRTISYLEAHGTGTFLGDPIEIAGLSKAYKSYTLDQQFCAIGSVKSNIGHCESAAGIAGVTKVLLQLKHQQLAPSLHAGTMNPNIDFSQTPFRVQQELVEWTRPAVEIDGHLQEYPRIAGVSSFGAGGVNAHVIIEEYITASLHDAAAPTQQLAIIVLSAKSEDRLIARAKQLLAAMKENTYNDAHLRDIAYTLQVGREAMDERLALIVSSIDELRENLQHYVEGRTEIDKVFRSQTKHNKAALDVFDADEELREAVEKWMERGKYAKLLDLWVKGLHVDWRRLYAGDEVIPRRVSLPTYPFAGERYWVPKLEAGAKANGVQAVVTPPHIHPLLHTNTSDLARQRFSSTFTGEEFFFSDHGSTGRKMLAAATYLEMARAAVEQATGLRDEAQLAVTLQHVLWHEAVVVEHDPVQVHIELFWEDNGDIGYEIYVKDVGNGNMVIGSQGRASISDAVTAETLNLPALLAQCNQQVRSSSECEEMLNKHGLSNKEGNSEDGFRIQMMHVGEGQALAKLKLPIGQADNVAMFTLHPGIIHSALYAAASFAAEWSLQQEKSSLTWSPLGLQELVVLRPCSSSMWAWIRTKNHNRNQLDIDLLDDKGVVCVQLIGLDIEMQTEFAAIDAAHGMMTPSQSGVKIIPVVDNNVNNSAAAFETMTFEEIWKEQALSHLPSLESAALQTIVCFLSLGENQQAAEDAIRFQHPQAKLIFIAQGVSRGCEASGNIYSITSDDGQSYKEAFRQIRERQGEPDAIFYLWAIEDRSCIRDFSGIVYMLQAMHAEKIKSKQLVLAGNFENELDFCYLDSWIGFKQSLRMVMPKLQVYVIHEDVSGKAEKRGITEQVSTICSELREQAAQSVLYQDGRRFVNHIQPTTLTRGTRSIRKGGTYLITGGAGGLGLLFAEALAASYAVNLILVGRSTLNAAKQAKIEELEALGGRVMYLQADIGDQEGMRSVLRIARQQFGNINGVIHAAGTMSSNTIFEKGIEEFQHILAPKVKGTMTLDELLKEDDPDFICYFSSSSAILGDFGFCDYAAANRFQMSYAQYRHQQEPGKTIVINWPLWKNGGMSFSNDVSTQMYIKTSGQRLLEDAEGVSLFEQIISQNTPQHLIMVGQRERVHRFLGLGEKPERSAQAHSENLKHSVTLTSSSTIKGRLPAMKNLSLEKCVEWDLKQLTAQLLKIPREQLGLDENLAEFGFDSVSLAEFSGLISAHYQIEITPALFFEYSTLRRFAQYMLQACPDTILAFYGDESSETTEPAGSRPAIVPTSCSTAADSMASKYSMSAFHTFRQISEQRTQGSRSRFVGKLAGNPDSSGIGEPIAIIGMSGRFPEARTIDELWNILVGQNEVISEIAQERPFIEGLKHTAWKGGFVPGVSEFDPLFFEISPREAENMDPRQRLLLQESWKALEDAGYGANQLKSNKIGMFIGVENNDDYLKIAGQSGSITSNHHAILAARLSYFLNLSGPNMAINTACSSGLVALHQACMSLRLSECDTAIAAGISLLLAEESFSAMSQAGMLSEEGRCYAFDQRANGMVPAEAVAAIVLKRLSHAKRDGDPIYAVIRGSGINHDGKTNGITAPNGLAQANLLKDIYNQYNVNPEEIEYVVTHGTGTRLGDPVEVNALVHAFQARTNKEGYCALTSSKTNLGHTLAASGIVSLIGLVQSMRHGIIPASLHCEQENDYIQWKHSPFYVNKQNKPWLIGERGRTGAVSAFGMSGTNAHVVVQSYEPQRLRNAPDGAACYLLPLSAKTVEALQEKILQMVETLESNLADVSSLSEISYTLFAGRHHFKHRCAIVVRDIKDAALTWKQTKNMDILPNVFRGVVPREFEGQAAIRQYILELLVKCEQTAYDKTKHQEILCALGELYCQGYDIPLDELYDEGARPVRIHLPTYPFAREHHWVPEQSSKSLEDVTPLGIGKLMFEPVWQEKASDNHIPLPQYADHVVILTDWHMWLREAVAAELPTATCIHLPAEAGDIVVQFESYAVQLLNYMKKLIQSRPAGNILIQLVVPEDGEQQLFAGLAGLLKTARLENPQLLGQLIEVPSGENGVKLVDKLKENRQHPENIHIRYDTGTRFIESWNEINIDLQEAEAVPWKPGGVYLITGGAGGLGLLFAQEIARYAKGAALILAGRSELNRYIKEKIGELETLGARVVYQQADINDREAAYHLIRWIREQFGSINGIINSAGIIRDNYLLNKSDEEVQDVLAPKVAGVVHLDEASKDENLDFFLLFSSIAGALGNPGQADYAMGNAFMDRYVKYRNEMVAAGTRRGRTISINWPLWKDGAMHVDSNAEERMNRKTGLIPLQTKSGFYALYQAFRLQKSRVMPLEGTVGKLRHYFFEMQSARPLIVTAVISDSSADMNMLTAKTLAKFKVFLGEALKLDVALVDALEPFESYGIDSIIITQLNEKLESLFGEISKTLFFEYLTLSELNRYFVSHHTEKCRQWTGLDKAFSPIVQLSSATELAVDTADRSDAVLLSKEKKEQLLHEAAETAESSKREPIAIIGLSGHYPQADSLESFWANLVQGKDCIEEIPQDRWTLEGFYEPDRQEAVAQGKSYSKWGGFVGEFANFDPLFFNISPREALNMDPQERLFIQSCWEALEDAGYTREQVNTRHKGRVGVYAGITKTGFSLYGPDLWRRGEEVFPFTSFSSLANRVSYLLNLKGPSMPIDTMCSSSLTAVHEACEHLYRGECELAIAGAVNLYLHPSNYTHLCGQQMLSDDGKCKSFGKGANGFVPGEGVGVFILKPLSKAVADEDHIYAVIRGTSINHGGKTNGYTVPSPTSQGELVRDALDKAGINARSVSYMEAHGTGTDLGDPIEITGLVHAFAQDTKDAGFCAIGSVKSNIGHLEAAAGMAGMTKIMLQMKHKQLVPSLHTKELNPNISFAYTPFVVQQELAEWKRPIVEVDGQLKEFPRIAGISSFGAGGANAHVLLEEYIEQAEVRHYPAVTPQHPGLIVLSAKNEERLLAQAKQLLTVLVQHDYSDEQLRDAAYTLQVGREAMDERLALISGSVQELKAQLQGYIDGRNDLERVFRGQSKRNKEALSIFAADLELQDTIWRWMERKEYAKLLDLWVKGLHLDWHRLYGANKPRRMSLPTYPFAKERYWVPGEVMEAEWKGTGNERMAVDALPYLHPLLHSNTSDFSKQRFSSVFTGEEFFLRDHIVNGVKILPGAAYLELARAAVEKATAETNELSAIKLLDIVWTSPIRVENESIEVHIGLVPEDNGEIRFEIYQLDGEEEPTICSQGYARLCEMSPTPRLDLAAIQAACLRRTLLPSECYKAFRAMGIAYGEAYQGITQVYSGANEVLAKLKIPAVVADSARDYVIHPSLLDSAIQASIGLLPELPLERAGVYQPALAFALQEIEVLSSWVPEMWAWVQLCEGGGNVQKLDITLCSNTGEVCIRLCGFASRVFADRQPSNSAPKAISAGTALQHPTGAAMLTPVWEPFDLVPSNSVPASNERIVLVGRNEQLLHELRRMYPNVSALDVLPDSTIEDITRRLLTCEAIDHLLWAVSDYAAAASSDIQVMVGQEQGVHLAWKLIQSLLRSGYEDRKLGWTVVTVQAQAIHKYDESDPAQGAVQEYMSFITRRFANWSVRLVDLEAGTHPLSDIFVLPPTAKRTPFVYRDQEWHRQELLPVTGSITLSDKLYRQGGVYVLIGEPGELETAWSEYMIRTYGAHLFWIVSNDTSGSLRTKLMKLAGLGPAPTWLTANLVDSHALQRAYSEIKRQYTRIHGVIQSSIQRSGCPFALAETNWQQTELGENINAVANMAQVFQHEPLDFVLFFTSPGKIEHEATNLPQEDTVNVAGSSFISSFAHSLSLKWACPVKIMHWDRVGTSPSHGGWGRTEPTDVENFDFAEVMEAVEVLLTGPTDEAVLIDSAGSFTVEGVSWEKSMVIL
ncbi:SDR family NAD(P)-dependent oxidoreductase [Paenibacillus sp. ACRRX]|uniref:SDR family NAD(P)-dependent oxidoreductase n=1 Tax=Paenibacillus sp. ACRRX TaxID=2918206 RepID=UPI001EF560F4|nr:SDR family NAD(P)-dependent oxidoreductase [Paenibacillus sp. ACRRX]MCG7407083.1 SDR family NAD(P)-dependent oxidoreductase [Paenibacillus sp. ACRRX]